tara:strand:+ start:1822 stop:2160 length:339 start_codon:yes stop_codon:yes gene_type:complete
MFFPFKNYITVDHTFIDAGNSLAHTIVNKSLVVIELISTNTSGINDAYSFSVFSNFNRPSTVSIHLFSYVAGGGNGSGDSGSGILPAGAQIYMNRPSQYGASTIRIHIFELP